VNVVGYDYTGYGASRDSGIAPTEKQTYKDIKAAYDYCLSTKLVTDPAKEIILYGQSVGSGPSCYLASKLPIAGIVLHSPIMSGLRVITDSRMLACFDIFPNLKRIRRIKAPLFVIHGKVRM
jgi:pimeloyl-ACP methyl ester carboxylesterase